MSHKIAFAHADTGAYEAFLRTALDRAPFADVVHLPDAAAVSRYFVAASKNGKPRLLVLDRRLPGRDAIDVFTEIRLNPRFDDVEVVFLVDSAREEAFLRNSFNCPSVRKPAERHIERFLAFCDGTRPSHPA